MTSPAPADPAPDDVRRGIVLMLVAVLLFSILNVLVKLLAARYPVVEVAFFRNAFALVPVAVMVAADGGWKRLRTRRPLSHLWRSSIGLTTMLAIFWSFHLLPLADATAISFSAPLFLTALSVPLLGERVGMHRWSAVLVGFAGVLVMVRPTGDVLNFGALVALASALFNALAMVAVRQLSRTEAPVTIVAYFTMITTGLTALMLPFGWIWPTPPDFALFALLGLTGGVAQYFLTRAYSLGPAAVIGPFNYTNLLWATVFGLLVWGELPTAPVMAGGLIVVASGLYILYRETCRRVAVVRAAAPGAGD